MGNQCSSPKDISVDDRDQIVNEMKKIEENNEKVMENKVDHDHQVESTTSGTTGLELIVSNKKTDNVDVASSPPNKKREKEEGRTINAKNKSQVSLVTTEADVVNPEKLAKNLVEDILVEAQIKLDTRDSDTLPPFVVRMRRQNNFQLKMQNLLTINGKKVPPPKNIQNSVNGGKTVQLIISSDQKKQLKKSYIAAGKLLPPQNPVEKIHQICQHTILNEKSSPMTPIVMTRSEREDGKKFLQNLVANLAKNDNGITTMNGKPVVAVDFIENILKIHKQAQALLVAESGPKKLNFGSTDQLNKSTTTTIISSDPAPLPPHVVRKAADDLKKIQILAQESVRNVSNKNNNLMDGNGRQNSIEIEDDYAVPEMNDQDGQKGIKFLAKKTENSSEALYATVHKPKEAQEGSKFAVSFADRPNYRKEDDSEEEDEKEYSEVSEKRSRLMHRKQTGIVFPKFGHMDDLTDEDDDDENETSSDSDSSCTESADETVVVTSATKSLTNGPSVKEKEEPVSVSTQPEAESVARQPIRKKVVGDLIARFEQGKA